MITAVTFIVLTAAIWLFGTVTLDRQALEAVIALATPSVVRALRVVNYAGEKLVLIPAMVVLYAVFPRARRRWWIWAALMLAAPTAEGLVKLMVGRARPLGEGFAFPSGHATAASAYFGALFYLAGALSAPALRVGVRAIALAAIVLVALARIVLRAHWPSDVLAGAALGLALASAAALAASAQVRAEED
jgi:undecaprenyl-diphosphatase